MFTTGRLLLVCYKKAFFLRESMSFLPLCIVGGE